MFEGRLDPQRIIIHLAGGATILFVCGYVLYSMLGTEKIEPCSERFPPATLMALRDPHGRLHTPIAFKSYIGRAQRGLVENARPSERDGPAGKEAVLQVRMDKGTSDGYSSKTIAGGVGFAWSPTSLQGATSACLAYDLYLPHDFDPGSGGLLPGLFAGKALRADQSADGQKSASARMVWGRDGKAGMLVQVPGASNSGNVINVRTHLPKGRWFPVRQEIVMNEPGESNGILRLWIDRKLALEQRNVLWRKEPGLALAGVISEVTYGGPRAPGGAPKTTVVQITPFGLSWQGDGKAASMKVSAASDTPR